MTARRALADNKNSDHAIKDDDAKRDNDGEGAVMDGAETAGDPWPDLAGRINGEGEARFHQLPVRVYFEDTDFSGVVYHASYLRWCERGRSDFLRLLGNDHRGLISGGDGAEPAAFVVRRMALEYLKPARIDDVLTVETRVAQIGAASLELAQFVLRGELRLFEAKVLVVLVSQSGKPQRLSRAIRAAFKGQQAAAGAA